MASDDSEKEETAAQEDSLNEADTQEEEEQFETTPEKATGFGGSLKPKILERKKILIIICGVFALFLGGALIYSNLKPEKKKTSAAAENELASSTSTEFLTSLRDRAAYRREQEAPKALSQDQETAKEEKEPEPALPPVSFNKPPETKTNYPTPTQQTPPASGGGGQAQQKPTHFSSPLVPPIQGSLFAQGSVQGASQNMSYGNTQGNSQTTTPRNPYSQPYGQNDYNSQYDQQNKQDNKQAFYDASSGGTAPSGNYIGVNSVWTGTIIPGILETSINTDIPGNVLARVTQNIFDSQTGRNLLIPQGTILLARYNSSISYAQKRVQIVWDTMIRPDGFQINLEGANGVDKAGMSGQPAKIHENWFEYLKAAGIITLFSYANAKMTETAAKYADKDSTSSIATSNADFVSELGDKLSGRATNIQPTLTVDNGTVINIMLNKNLYLPPVTGYPATEKYSLE